MKSRIRLFFSYALYWLSFFVLARLFFLIYYSGKVADLGFSDTFLSILNGLRLDLSAVGYFMLLPGLFLVASSFTPEKFNRILFGIYTIALMLICTFVVILDLEMYKHWGFRLDATPLLYVGQDTTVAIGIWPVIQLALIWSGLAAISLYGYKKLITPQLNQLPGGNVKTAVVLLLITACMIAPIRGTAGVAPINTGTVYFHPNNMFANHAAINVVWNTGYALTKMNRLKYPNNYMNKKQADKHFKQLLVNTGDSHKFLNTDRPNIVLIILESYTYKFIEPLGGRKGVAPNFNTLTKEGILFDNFYASGDRTDKGIVSILSGYPAQPLGSIIKYPRKTQQLPFINKEFSNLGYTTGFTYGGNIDFANFRSYLSNAGFNNITHSAHFPDSLNQSKWGVHDEFVFDKFLNELNNTNEPFFKVMLSLSSHEPFEVPMETAIPGDDKVSKFLNSAHYTDKCLGKFIGQAKKSHWWDNTLVIITADHGHGMPDNGGVNSPNRYKIPMLWLGGALNKRDTVIHEFGNQTDIPNTILGQVNRPIESFTFSNNILDKHHNNFAVFVYNNGYGYIEPNMVLVYDNVGKQYIKKEGVNDKQDLLPGMSYMQKLYTDYNNR